MCSGRLPRLCKFFLWEPLKYNLSASRVRKHLEVLVAARGPTIGKLPNDIILVIVVLPPLIYYLLCLIKSFEHFLNAIHCSTHWRYSVKQETRSSYFEREIDSKRDFDEAPIKELPITPILISVIFCHVSFVVLWSMHFR